MAKRKSKPQAATTPDKWMQNAVNPEHEGDFSAKAKAAGMGTQEYANKVTAEGSKASTKTKRQANLAKVFAKYRKGKKVKKKGG